MRSNPFYETYIDGAVKALNKAGVSMENVPEEIRQETFQLEPLMMIAERKGDVIKYMAIVNKWRDLFLKCVKEISIEEKEEEVKPWQKQQSMQQMTLLI